MHLLTRCRVSSHACRLVLFCPVLSYVVYSRSYIYDTCIKGCNAKVVYHHRYRTSRLSHDAEREPGARLGQQQVTQHAEAGEPAEEEDPEWDAAADLVDSDASSEGSDMSVILAGDPAEAAAADVYG